MTDAELQRRTGEPHIDGWPLYSGLPPPQAVHTAAAELARPMTERDQFDMAMWHARLGELADAYYEAGRTNPARQRARADLMLHALECATGWRTRSALAAHTAAPQAGPVPATGNLLLLLDDYIGTRKGGASSAEIERAEAALGLAIMAAEAAHTAAAGPSGMAALLELQEWRAALQGLCIGHSDTWATPELAAKNVKARIARATAAAPPPAQAQAEPNNLPVGRVRVSDGELHIHPSVRDPDDRDALKDGQYVYATPPAAAAPQAQAVRALTDPELDAVFVHTIECAQLSRDEFKAIAFAVLAAAQQGE